MARVIDSMLYFNEIELFCARYDLLKDSVDRFCIFEAGTTFTGLPKPGSFWVDLERIGFEVDRSRVSYLLVDALPNREAAQASGQYANELQMLSGLDAGLASQWFKEHLSRELMKRTFVSEAQDAVILVSDIDEIPTPEAISKASRRITEDPDAIVSIEMNDYVGSVGCDMGKVWEGTFAMTKQKAMTVCLSAVRTLDARTGKRSCTGVVRVARGGWHFSSFGGRDTVQRKIMAWGHQELNRWDIRVFLGANIALGKDIFGRDILSRMKDAGTSSAGLQPSDYFQSGRVYSGFIYGKTDVQLKVHLLRWLFICVQFGRRVCGRLGLLST